MLGLSQTSKADDAASRPKDVLFIAVDDLNDRIGNLQDKEPLPRNANGLDQSHFDWEPLSCEDEAMGDGHSWSR